MAATPHFAAPERDDVLAIQPAGTEYEPLRAPAAGPSNFKAAMDHTDLDTPIRNRSITDRMIGAATLDIATYEEVEHDETATRQAAVVVGIVALCSAIGSFGGGVGGMLGSLLAAYVGWAVWSGVAYVIGDKVFGGTATWGELLRTIGFAQTPGVLLVVAIIPILGWIVSFVVWIWMMVTGVVAIRQALDFSTGKAVMTAILGLVGYVAVGLVFGMLGALF